ncbi:DUF1833 domain-containing protein [Bradyrhizobium sp. G127]|uniref:DUF1833 domain-containing protein n=1 Tax=Bradyrhizobium sp. G127 TaxID=2904800 RepID=UPI001F18A763|nr:DUF1833 domain-containing protein [Bradyrhizobium sp. G127]MCF2522350.1 DUF1833 domain-containing protein [Bradyrhizobium sp. G127]
MLGFGAIGELAFCEADSAANTPFRNAAEASATDEVFVIFATITHPDLSMPVCVNDDIVDYVYNGLLFRGSAFSCSLVTDNDSPPRAQASIQNVDQEIGETIQALSSPPLVKIELLLKSDFTNDIPRLPIGRPRPEYVADMLRLRNVKGDVMTVTSDLTGFDLTTEPYPAIRSTQDRLPGLYR